MSEYINPKRIVAESGADSSERILADNSAQALLNDTNCVKLNDKGYILLDFGRELCGGVIVTIQSVLPEDTKLRVVFGESAAEALSEPGDKNSGNYHTIRDMTIAAVPMSTQRIGDTGFRFVRLEAAGGEILLRSVKAVPEVRDIEYRGSFKCSDELLNKIWETGAYTVQLNMHEYLWDGVKRDRLVWIGDMHPETSVIQAVFGDDECVTRSLDLLRDDALSCGGWMNGFPTYTCWWVIIQHDRYMYCADFEYLSKQKDYMLRLSDMMTEFADSGFRRDGDRLFVDWSSKGQLCETEGVKSVLCIALKCMKKMLEILGESDSAKKCGMYHERLKNEKADDSIEINNRIAALIVLAERNTEKTLNRLLNTTEYEMSCFMGFYVLQALSVMNKNEQALEITRRYWGKMIELGATTFWEEFKMDWAENASGIDEPVPDGKSDIHGDFGECCYEGYRLSLCHGWAGGPAAFLMQSIAGIKILEPGCKKLAVNPRLSGLEWADIKLPTPYGAVRVECRQNGERTETKITAPDEVEIITDKF